MNFIKRIWNTKKIQKAKKISEKHISAIDKKYDVSETVEETLNSVKEKIEDINETYDISEKIKNAGENISEKVEAIGDKLESTLDEKIDFEDFTKVEIRIGEILEVKKIEKSDKLLKLKVDLGEAEARQIISGISTYYSDPEKELTGKQALFVANLAPRKIFGYESDGMIFAANDKENFSILSPSVKIQNGTLAG